MKWFTSDLHLGQVNIIRKFTKWSHADPDSLRDFDSVDHMDKTIIDNINKYVTKHDELYILGDVSFHSNREKNHIKELYSQINCKNMHLILGNHDHLIRSNINDYFDIFPVISVGLELYFKYPLEGSDPNRDPWQGKAHIVLNHYAHRVWNQSHRGAWMLYGHSHASLDNTEPQKGISKMINEFYNQHKTMDVGIDNINRIIGEYRPISFQELLPIMNKRKDLVIDHHEKH